MSHASYLSYSSHGKSVKREAPRIAILLFLVAFGYWKCYYLFCFKESDSWSMIFDIGGSRKIAAIGLERGRFLVSS